MAKREGSTKNNKPPVVTATDKRRLRREEEIKKIESLGQRALTLANNGPLDSSVKLFTELPISELTLQGLERAHYAEMTEIQHKSLPYALAKRDVLGAAKTGSGKTLAFLIPILEILYRHQWTQLDGLGALVISPTRELAMQIFEVLCKIGRYHKLSAGLIIGGKQVEEEKAIMGRMNILVCTPGRLLQHMDETAGFDCDNLQVLVLDEADRILDLGFKKTMNAIIENLPRQRQTLLFSATQTKSVKDLARLSLERPEYVGVHEKDRFSTPSKLLQHYMTVELPQKLDMLYSFLRTHANNKVIVFLSSGKQVRFVYETFTKARPGIPLLHMHGKQKQMRRVEIFEKFKNTTKAALLCTDVAARGLDFPAVDWVVQVDCPEDCDTYLHRVGRTARYEASGKSLLFLLPTEAPEMIRLLNEKNIPIKEISPKGNKVLNVSKQLQHFCFQDSETKYLGQRAFVTYVRSVFLQKNKKVFDVDKLPLEEFAESLGLPGAPQVKFVKRKGDKNKSYEDENSLLKDEREQRRKTRMEEIERENTADTCIDSTVKTKADKMFARKNANVLAGHYQKLVDHSDTSDGEGDFTLKRADHPLGESDDNSVKLPNIPSQELSKRQLRKMKEKLIKNTRNNRVVFDDDGNARPIYELQDEDSFRQQGDVNKMVDEFQQRNRILMDEADVADREADQMRRKEKRIRRKIREREELGLESSQTLAVLKTDDFSGNDSSEDEAPRDKRSIRMAASDDELQTSKPKKQRSARVLEVDNSAMTLEDQEQLALQLLGSG
ncbi:DEAD-domain-containing protein [Coemansia reversa NRRL 1564]|uniref:ATP-dependent RNA helicase n=1 Tax=Coemansia reversa (strain ATCC 12441 / NRRL 1564) TaxID=763665 RepID=A0A2G5BAI8_COERN|nr:DEAD-domain-containing protein [Coemansia reversa NRRL 1564]|eukprot:PIA16024.1 DEAD-domain-containing protein [Coemansia reversa NRRL 1564]